MTVGVSTSSASCAIRDADDDEATFARLLAVEAGLMSRAVSGSLLPGGPCVPATQLVRVARRYGRVVGYSQLSLTGVGQPGATLDYLYVHHDARGRGVGRALHADVAGSAGRLGLAGVEIVAHPAAEVFFRRVGAVRVGTVSSPTEGLWSRPRFVVEPVA